MNRKKVLFALGIILLVIIELQNVNVAKANPMYTQIPPKVNVPEMNVNATISKVNGLLWVKIDAEYQMHTIYGFGEGYLAQNRGMGLLIDPSPYVTVTVTQNTLDAHYPIPLNVTNLSVKINGKEIDWQLDNKGFFHIFDANIAEVNWTISPIPRDFLVIVHYEQPISKTSEAYKYLGDYAFTLPLYGRYGCSVILYPLYDWAGYPPTEYNIQIESTIFKIAAYSINNRGTLTPLNTTTSTENGFEKIKATVTHGVGETTAIQGAVAVFNSPIDETETFPPAFVLAASGAVVAVIVVGLVFFLRKRKTKDWATQLNSD
jgi:hypothetical protein